MIEKSDCIFVGTVTKHHGYDGRVVIRADQNRTSEDLMWDTLHVMIDGGLVPFAVDEVKERNDMEVLCKFELINSQEDAEELIGQDVYIERVWQEGDNMADGGEEEMMHIGDLVGFKLFESSDESLVGTIVDVDLRIEQNPLFVVERANSGEEVLIPVVEEWITAYDAKKKELAMDLPLGLFEE
ncbi:MAG: ribosome maturation factor RimM [Bacteroidales bacterium]|nr:ribosome maturation factor RimM [Bacteroidales bacterium]